MKTQIDFMDSVTMLRGGDLFSHVSNREDSTTEEALSKWIKQILLGVSHIHAQGVVHRDLKPANLLFLDNQHSILKVIDFGYVFFSLIVCNALCLS